MLIPIPELVLQYLNFLKCHSSAILSILVTYVVELPRYIVNMMERRNNSIYEDRSHGATTVVVPVSSVPGG